MKKMRILLSLLIAIAVVCAMMTMVSCSDDETDGSQSSGTSSKDEGSSTTDSSVTDSSSGGTNSSGTDGSSNAGDSSTDNSSNVDGSTTDTSSGTGGSSDSSSNTGDSSTDNSSTSGSSSGTTTPGGDDKPVKSDYTILILDKNTGKPIPNVSVYLQDEESYEAIAYARGKTDENGVCVLSAEAKYAKFVYVEGFKKGYVYNDFYALGPTGVEIKVATEIIENTNNNFDGKQLALGDVMYDFELSAYVYNKETGKIETKQIKLSDLFANGKKAVMLNFWYTTCTYCIEEFPFIQSGYEQYGDEIEIIGINAYAADNDKDIMEFMQNFAKPGVYVEDGCPLTFPMIRDTVGIQDAFGFTVNPCSVMIDRYGVISMIQIGGVLGERYFTNAFDHYVSDKYEN